MLYIFTLLLGALVNLLPSEDIYIAVKMFVFPATMAWAASYIEEFKRSRNSFGYASVYILSVFVAEFIKGGLGDLSQVTGFEVFVATLVVCVAFVLHVVVFWLSKFVFGKLIKSGHNGAKE